MNDTPTSGHDGRSMRQTAMDWTGADFAAHVRTAARRMHANKSLHLHELGDDVVDDGACRYCWCDAGWAVKALRDAGQLSIPGPADPEPAPHGMRVSTGHHPLDGTEVHTYDIEHPPVCSSLPVGAVCWIEVHPDRHRIPGDPGTYRVVPVQYYTGDPGNYDPADTEERLAFERLDPDTGQYSPWQFPDEPPYAWAAWGQANQLLAFGLHLDGASGWESLGLPERDASVIHLEPLNRAAYEVLASLVGFDDPAPMGHTLRDRFLTHRQHALPLLSLSVIRTLDPADGARMTGAELFEALSTASFAVANDSSYTGSISWVMLPGQKRYGVQALLTHMDGAVNFITDPAAMRGLLSGDGAEETEEGADGEH